MPSKTSKVSIISLMIVLSIFTALFATGGSFSASLESDADIYSASKDQPSYEASQPIKEESSSEFYERTVRSFDTNQGSADVLPVLMYHHLLPAADNIYPEEPAVMNLEIFEQQMAYLADQGFTTLTLKEAELFLRGELEIPRNSILITFDDGYASEAVYAADVLRRYDLKAASFLITSQIEDETEDFHPHELSYLSWEQIQENRDVFEYAHHSHDMHHLEENKSLLVVCCEDTLREDLRASLSLLESPYFAYPYGHKDCDVIQTLKDKDYRMAFSTREEMARPGEDLFRVGRFGITYHVSFERFQSIVHGYQ